MVFKTPSGFEVTLKDNFTYGDYRKIVKSFLRNTSVNFSGVTKDKKTPEFSEMSADKILDYQEYALDVLILKIIKNGKEITANFKTEIDSWLMPDGQAIYVEVDKVLNKINASGEKKE